jgi:ubiquinone/menaquinone biosynthesis C-methylase UbiE
MPLFRRGPGPHALPLAMSGIKLGERFLHVGSGKPAMFAALAARVGLTGRAAAIADGETAAEALRKAAVREGVLVDIAAATAGSLPHDRDSFDLAVIDSTDGAFGTMGPVGRAHRLTELVRVIRPGGRLLVVEAAHRGLRRLLRSMPADADYRSSGGAKPALEAAGFRPVRILAERDGFRFTEGIKPGAH